MPTSSEKLIHLDDANKTRERILMNFIYPDDYPISDKEQWILSRWQQIYANKKRFKSDTAAIKMLVEWAAIQNRPISKETAYRDLVNAQWFYGELFHQDPQFKLLMYAEWFEELAELAREQNNFKEATNAIDKAANIRIKLWEAKNKIDPDQEKKETVKNFNLQVNVQYNNGKASKEKNIAMDDITNLISQDEIIDIVNNVPANNVTQAEMLKMLRKGKHARSQDTDA